jgi:lipopolysaccharide/colanic/teichoic acid biosynthesis glycosyltransferase
MTTLNGKFDTPFPAITPEARETTPSPIRARAALPDPADLFAATATSAGVRRLRAWITLRAWQLSLRLRPFLRRSFDVVATSAALICLSPLLLLTAFAIRIESSGPILFRQTRVGKRGRLFTMYKFRSMRVTAEAEKSALTNRNESEDGVLFKMKADPRITRVGRLLRRLSIDELPQLLNILRGDMSIVGPRPPLPLEVEQYTAEDRKRLHAKPGLTCLWQISGRSDLSFAQQVRLDIRYLANRSLGYDLKIILKTIPAVLGGKGAY